MDASYEVTYSLGLYSYSPDGSTKCVKVVSEISIGGCSCFISWI